VRVSAISASTTEEAVFELVEMIVFDKRPIMRTQQVVYGPDRKVKSIYLAPVES
jgi:hypothetical protein